ncbi:zinc finger protein ZAT3-like [Juglans microcarpa x Juglans regia]|uniref:zinc finger protein ZAT3-like n=1 Tax=Juglans microcarpa x Juglans regia TaxID=2249226 RepID=UPI001B7E63D3|nr:zinc finger protein ZAT3-like [Juglans microcarpa x Juglans regia]
MTTTTTGSDLCLPSSPSLHEEKARRKKRSKPIRIDGMMELSSSGVVSKPKYAKKPDPSAPKITRPCSECGKKFWSWKALFGHMRCHPERQWRGINPPPNLRRPVALALSSFDGLVMMSQEDHEVAACLLMMANGGNENEGKSKSVADSYHQEIPDSEGLFREEAAEEASFRFECSSCKKVFGSHQALGGHRASHKNVKGCFAITRSDGDQVEDPSGADERDSVEDKVLMVLGSGHKCSICLRVFSSGQALGGHKRCHWEKGDDPSMLSQQGLSPCGTKEGFGLDLNMPAPVEDGSSSSNFSSELTLDLRLGL